MSYEGMRDGIVSVRATLRDLGMGTVPIEITEAGMTTAWVSEAVRAKAIGTLARTLPTDKALNVTRFLPYEWAAPEKTAAMREGPQRAREGAHHAQAPRE